MALFWDSISLVNTSVALSFPDIHPDLFSFPFLQLSVTAHYQFATDAPRCYCFCDNIEQYTTVYKSLRFNLSPQQFMNSFINNVTIIKRVFRHVLLSSHYWLWDPVALNRTIEDSTCAFSPSAKRITNLSRLFIPTVFEIDASGHTTTRTDSISNLKKSRPILFLSFRRRTAFPSDLSCASEISELPGATI